MQTIVERINEIGWVRFIAGSVGGAAVVFLFLFGAAIIIDTLGGGK